MLDDLELLQVYHYLTGELKGDGTFRDAQIGLFFPLRSIKYPILTSLHVVNLQAHFLIRIEVYERPSSFCVTLGLRDGSKMVSILQDNDVSVIGLSHPPVTVERYCSCPLWHLSESIWEVGTHSGGHNGISLTQAMVKECYVVPEQLVHL